jgi:hypothetical protein
MDSGCELGCFGSVLLAEYRHASERSKSRRACRVTLRYKSNSSSFGWIQGWRGGKNGEGLEIGLLACEPAAEAASTTNTIQLDPTLGTRVLATTPDSTLVLCCPSSSIKMSIVSHSISVSVHWPLADFAERAATFPRYGVSQSEISYEWCMHAA